MNIPRSRFTFFNVKFSDEIVSRPLPTPKTELGQSLASGNHVDTVHSFRNTWLVLRKESP